MADSPDDDVPDPDEDPPGYRNPPKEYRWPKGYCPNPKGRPRKKTVRNEIMPLNEFEQRMLDEARKVVTNVDGKPFTQLDSLVLQLRTSNRPEDRKLLLSYYEAALKADRDWREEAVRELIEYKQYWGPRFEIRRKLGKPLPKIYPDPADVVIISPTEFRFIGPVTEEEAADWEFFIKARQTLIFCANEIIEIAGLYRPVEEDHKVYLRYRRTFYRWNRYLPRIFKKKHPVRFPSFIPPTEPPDWYEEDGEWNVSSAA